MRLSLDMFLEKAFGVFEFFVGNNFFCFENKCLCNKSSCRFQALVQKECSYKCFITVCQKALVLSPLGFFFPFGKLEIFAKSQLQCGFSKTFGIYQLGA